MCARTKGTQTCRYIHKPCLCFVFCLQSTCVHERFFFIVSGSQLIVLHGDCVNSDRVAAVKPTHEWLTCSVAMPLIRGASFSGQPWGAYPPRGTARTSVASSNRTGHSCQDGTVFAAWSARIPGTSMALRLPLYIFCVVPM